MRKKINLSPVIQKADLHGANQKPNSHGEGCSAGRVAVQLMKELPPKKGHRSNSLLGLQQDHSLMHITDTYTWKSLLMKDLNVEVVHVKYSFTDQGNSKKIAQKVKPFASLQVFPAFSSGYEMKMHSSMLQK